MKQYTELTGEEIVINTQEYEAKAKDLDLKDIELIKTDGLWYWVIKCPVCIDGKIEYTTSYDGGHPCDYIQFCEVCDKNCHVNLMIQPCEKYPEDINKMGMDYLWDIMYDNKMIRNSVNDDINECTEEKQHENISGSNLDSVDDELQP